MPDTPEIVAAVLIILAAATVVSTVGFGLGITATPLLLLVFEPQTVVVVANVISALMFVLILAQSRNDLPVRRIAPLAVAGALGAPVGVVVLATVSSSALRISIAVLILALSAAIALNFRGTIPRPRLFGPAIGFGTGGLIAALGIGGPIMALFLLGQGMDSRTLRVSLAFYFMGMSIIALIGYAVAGLYTAERAIILLIVTVPALAGFWLGSTLLRHMNEAVFRRGVLVVIIFSSLLVLARELLSL